MTVEEMAEMTEITETSSMLKGILNVYSSRQTNPYKCKFSQKVRGNSVVLSAKIEINVNSKNVLDMYRGE